MACLIKRAGIWTARIYVDGGEHWRSLKTSDRHSAERKAQEVERLLKGDRWLRQQFNELLTRVRREIQPDEVPLLCEAVGRALRDLLALMPLDRREETSGG